MKIIWTRMFQQDILTQPSQGRIANILVGRYVYIWIWLLIYRDCFNIVTSRDVPKPAKRKL